MNTPKQNQQNGHPILLAIIALIGCTATIAFFILLTQTFQQHIEIQANLLNENGHPYTSVNSKITEVKSENIPANYANPELQNIDITDATQTENGQQTPNAIEHGVIGTIVRAVDGDTVVALINNEEKKIRLLGVNTPESVDPRRPVECFGKEAAAYTKNLLEGKKVYLESDPSQGDTDKYGRLLRYIYLPIEASSTSGQKQSTEQTLNNINLQLIEEGYAYEYTYRLPYKYQTDFKQAQKNAEKLQKGLWSPNTCNKD